MSASHRFRRCEIADKLFSLQREVTLFVADGGLPERLKSRLEDLLNCAAAAIQELRCGDESLADSQQSETPSSPCEAGINNMPERDPVILPPDPRYGM